MGNEVQIFKLILLSQLQLFIDDLHLLLFVLGFFIESIEHTVTFSLNFIDCPAFFFPAFLSAELIEVVSHHVGLEGALVEFFGFQEFFSDFPQILFDEVVFDALFIESDGRIVFLFLIG